MLKRYMLHIPHGALAAILLATPGLELLGIAWVALIAVYQFLEDWRINDMSYLDFRGYMIGYAVVAVAVVIQRLIIK